MNETKIFRAGAETMYVNHPEALSGIFCYNNHGDLFLNSEWGFYAGTWRAFGDDFRTFLSNCAVDDIVSVMARTYNNDAPLIKFGGSREKFVSQLVEIFLAEIKNNTPTSN